MMTLIRQWIAKLIWPILNDFFRQYCDKTWGPYFKSNEERAYQIDVRQKEFNNYFRTLIQEQKKSAEENDEIRKIEQQKHEDMMSRMDAIVAELKRYNQPNTTGYNFEPDSIGSNIKVTSGYIHVEDVVKNIAENMKATSS